MSGRSVTIGPANGTLLLKTTRAGLAAQAGHDLTLEMARWSGTVVLAEDPAASTIEVVAEVGSLRVLDGSGGVLPLSERDRREILRNARRILGTDHAPTATYRSARVTPGAGGGTVEGMLMLLGKDRPLRLEFTSSGDDRFRCSGRVLQSDYGIKPYTALLGALKLADAVMVEADVDLAGSDQ